MPELTMIRHAPTAWNRQGRVQGRRDMPLDADGRAEAERWRVPTALDGFRWVSSPLGRCRETAALLGATEVAIDERLIERDWGEWEGQSIKTMRRQNRTQFKEYEEIGPQFRPPGGETHVEVQARMKSWLADIGPQAQSVVAVAHKGVIYAVYALATGWDFRGRPPHHLDWASAHLFAVDEAGHPHLRHLNMSLRQTPHHP